MELKNVPWKKSSDERPIATVIPEKVIARPAVAIVRISAASVEAPVLSSSRKRDTIISE